MRQVSEQTAMILESGSFETRLVCDVLHGSQQVMENIDLADWTAEEDLGAEIKSHGSATVIASDDNGESLLPRGADGLLSPFRASVVISQVISAGGHSERVQLGMGRIVKTPPGHDTYDGELVVTSKVPIVWDGMDRVIWRDGFTYPESPPQRSSAWTELARITGRPVIRNMPDVSIPAGTVWEAKQGGRLAATQKLAELLGGRAILTAHGAVTIAPYTLGPIVARLNLGNSGTIVELETEISTEGVYNRVVGRYEDEERKPIDVPPADIRSGPLAVGGLYGVVTRYHESDMVKTRESAIKAQQAVLDESIGSQTYAVQVQCITDPRIQINDHVMAGKYAGRVVSVSRSGAALMTVKIEVPRVIV